jgi:3-hydroxybutyryl-CoA dehydrogenase
MDGVARRDSVTTVAVLGLGTMGHGIAEAFALGGLAVRCFDAIPAVRSGVVDRIQKNLEPKVKAGILTAESAKTVLGRLQVCGSEAEAAQPAQFIAEAVAEDLKVKQELFARLEEWVAPDAILASNSSGFPMTAIALRMRRPERAVLCHWFNPAAIVPVVEVAPGQRTSEETVHTSLDLLRRIGKTAIHIKKEIPGLVVNRVQMALRREIFDLLERGIASPAEIDEAIRGSMGLRLAALGPFQVLDFAGLDVSCQVYENLAPDLRADAAIPSRVRAMLDQGHFGVKTGQGFYAYTPASIQEIQARRDRLYLALVRLLETDANSTDQSHRAER